MEDVILVTGGAGYIGSHAARTLLEAGRNVVVVDDLSTGHAEVMALFSRVYGPGQFVFEHVSLLDPDGLKAVFERHGVCGVLDFAARSLVGVSQEQPRVYFDTNVAGFRNLVAAARGVPLIKSSTAATYGNPAEEDLPLVEGYQDRLVRSGRVSGSRLMAAAVDFRTLIDWYAAEIAGPDPGLALDAEDIERLKIPTNVYGITKLMDELILARTAQRGGGRFVVLRYFNVAGADRSRLIGEDHDPETHLIPIVLQTALGQRAAVTVFGTDYPTPDGTAVRDYIGVEDLVEAHLLCLEDLLRGGPSAIYNLGTRQGNSVREVIETARRVTGREIPERPGARRSGDPAVLVADSSRIRKAFGWEAKAPLADLIESAWRWHRLNPEGYRMAQEERFSPFWGRWINIAAHRGSRPWRGETQQMTEAEGKPYDPDCPLCPGNRRAGGQVNPPYTGVWSFANDFPSLRPDAFPVRFRSGPYAARTSRGICEVINYSPVHSHRLSTMATSEIAQVVEAWAETYARLGAQKGIRYVLIFENRGEMMGNSQPHPHCQVYAYGQIPDLMVAPQMREFRRYRKRTGGCFVCDANRAELEDGRRVLVDTDRFVAYVPFAAQFPYDVVVAPRAHAPSLLELDAGARRDLAETLRRVLGGLDGLFGVPYHYSMAVIQAPTDGRGAGFHMQVHIASLLRGPGLRKHVVGADIFGKVINPSDPNWTAEEVRRAMRRAGG